MRVDFVFDDGGMNLLSSAALRELRVILSEAKDLPPMRRGRSFVVYATQDDTDLFVFRSGRSDLFAAGADMAEMQRFGARDAEQFARLGQELFADIERLPCLTACVIDGDCFGGALDLALAFDFRIATPRSRFAHPGARLGIVTGFGGTSRWRKVISRPAANQLFLANRVLGFEEALAIGLVDDLTEADLERLASSPRARMVKQLTISPRTAGVLAGWPAGVPACSP